MFVFITEGESGRPGAAYRGTLCLPNDDIQWPVNCIQTGSTCGFKNGKELRLSVNTYKNSDKQLASVK